MKLSEPTSAVTDFILAVELFLLGALLAGGSSELSARLWAASFLVMGGAAVAGGTFHARRFAMDARSLQALRHASRVGIALSFGLLLAAGAASASGVLRAILFPASAVVVVMSPRGIYLPSERGWTTTNKAVAVVVGALAVLCLIGLLHRPSPAGMWILAGGLVTGAGIAVQQAGVRMLRHFNHNDLFHVMMMVAYYLWYRAGLLLRDP